MTIGTGRQPFSTLGDQQLLDQTKRLAANQRSLEVHILDHLDEIDRRSLALRRGFSSLFDYTVRELRFSDAAAQRRIQTMRLCRRHGWVRAMLHSGDLSLTAAAQMESAFAAAERQSRRASPTVGLEQCHDLTGLPASPSAACDRDAEEPGAGAGVAGAVAMTASAARGVAAGQEARSSGDAGGHEHGHTGSDRGRPSSEQPAAVSARPAAAGVQPVGRPVSSTATAGAAPPSMPERAGCRRKTSAPERRVESLRVGESREAGSKHMPDVPDRPDSNAATLHAPQQAAPGRAPRTVLAGKLAGKVAADTPVLPVASHAAARHRGTRHADALPAWLEANGAASPSTAPSRAADPAASSSDQRPAAPPLPLTSRATPVPLPVVAPAGPRPTAAFAPEPSQGDPIAELSAGPVSAPALLNPQRQREIIEQAAGMTTRQVAGLLATAAPEVVPPRDTLRAVAPDRFTLKVSIDRECEQGLRQLKDLRSHLDPRMSWGDLVALLVREAVARHDPRGGGRRRTRAGSAAASSRRGRSRTPAVVPPVARAGGGGDTQAPQGETAVAREQPRAAVPPNAAPVRGSAPAAPATGATPAGENARGTRSSAAAAAAPAAVAAPAVESHPPRSVPEPASATSAAMAAPQGQSAGARMPCPAPTATASGAPRRIAPAALAAGSRRTRPSDAPDAAAPQPTRGGPANGTDVPPISPCAAPAPKFASGSPADRSDAAPVPPSTPPPQFACSCRADGAEYRPIPPGAPPAPKFAGGGVTDGTDAALIPPDANPAPELAGGVPPARGAGGARTGASPQVTGDASRGPRRPPVRRPIPAAVRRHVWLRDGGRCCYRDPLTGRRCNSSHLLQIDHLLPVAEGGGPEPENLALSCFAHHRMRHGYGPAPPSK